MITGPSFCTKLQTVNTTKGASKEQKCKSTELLNWVRACLPTKNHKHINKALRKRGKKKKIILIIAHAANINPMDCVKSVLFFWYAAGSSVADQIRSGRLSC